MENNAIGIDKLIGMPVLSRTTGNKLGEVYDLYVDPGQGTLRGVTIKAPNGKFGGIDYDHIYSFGHDAVMAENGDNITLLNDEWIAQHPHAKRHIIGTKILTEGGNDLGQISNIFVQLTAAPVMIYELRGSMWDSIMGKNLYIYASQAKTLSDKAERLIVPDSTIASAASSLTELLGQPVQAENNITRTNSAR